MSSLLAFLLLQILSDILHYQTQPESCKMVLLQFPGGVEYLFMCLLIFLFSVIAYFASFAHFFLLTIKNLKKYKNSGYRRI